MGKKPKCHCDISAFLPESNIELYPLNAYNITRIIYRKGVIHEHIKRRTT